MPKIQSPAGSKAEAESSTVTPEKSLEDGSRPECLGLDEPLPLAISKQGCVDWLTHQDFKFFKLGKGTTQKKCKEGAEALLQREFPYLTVCEDEDPGKDRHVNFVPPEFHPVLSEVVVRDPEKWTEEQKEAKLPSNMKALKLVQQTIEGDELERAVYEQLRLLFGSMAQANVFVFCGMYMKWILEDQEGKRRGGDGEFDFIILSKELRLVIYIECKKGSNFTNLRKSQKQLERAYNFFNQNMPYSGGWQFVKTICTLGRPKGNFCKSCQTFMIWPEEHCFQQWWQNLQNASLASRNLSDSCTRIDFANLVKNVLFFALMQCNDNTITRHQSSSKVMQIIRNRSTRDYIMFWTKKQYQELYNNSRLLVLDSDYGTGKTELLKAKAKFLRESNKEELVKFYVHDDINICYSMDYYFRHGIAWKKKPSLLFEALKRELLHPEGIKVVSLSQMTPIFCSDCRSGFKQETCQNCSRNFMNVILKDLEDGFNVFIDDISDNSNCYMDLVCEKAGEIHKSQKFLWMALNPEDSRHHRHRKYPESVPPLKLEKNLRNHAAMEKYDPLIESFWMVIDSHCIVIDNSYVPLDPWTMCVDMIKYLSRLTPGDIALLADDESFLSLAEKRRLAEELHQAGFAVHLYSCEDNDSEVPHANIDMGEYLTRAGIDSRQRVLVTEKDLFRGLEAEAVLVYGGRAESSRNHHFRGVSYTVRLANYDDRYYDSRTKHHPGSLHVSVGYEWVELLPHWAKPAQLEEAIRGGRLTMRQRQARRTTQANLYPLFI